MPTTAPSRPTYLCQKAVTPASTATRGRPWAARTASRRRPACRTRRCWAWRPRARRCRPWPAGPARPARWRLRAGGDDDGAGAVGVAQHIAAAGDGGHGGGIALHEGQVLARQQQRGRAAVMHVHADAGRTRHGGVPGHGGLGRVAGTPERQVGDQAQAGGVLDRLVVGPSSPRPMESCVNTCTTRCFISAAMRMALRE